MGTSERDVLARLRSECRTPGSTVAGEISRRGVRKYVDSDAMDELYSESDAFLYESTVWNQNHIKSRMRRWVRKRLDAFGTVLGRKALDVLVIGDGPGFDSLYLAQGGYAVTYHELPGLQEQFARKLFERCCAPVRILTDRVEIPKGSFDAVTCLDVLEHVGDPPAVVRGLVEYLRPHGVLFSHAPFYMIHPAYPTHLRCNRRFSGRLSLYQQAGLRLVDGEIGWNPLLFQRLAAPPATAAPQGEPLRMFAVRAAGAYLALGRLSALPFAPVHWFRRAKGRWFEPS